MPLWKRYFFKEITKMFFFFLGVFFLLYSLLDYSLRMDDFIHNNTLQIKDIFSIYLNQFLKRAPLLCPLSLLIATIKILTSLNNHREWLVLQLTGLRTRHLLKPFFWAAAFCSIFNWVNLEYLFPSSMQQITELKIAHFKDSKKAQRHELIHLLTLKDNSKLVYQAYVPEENALFDVLWIRSTDDIWRIKFLNAEPTEPLGRYVDHLQRNSEGLFEKVGSFEKLLLSDLKWHPSMAGLSMIPFEERSISDLYTLLSLSSSITPYEIPKVISRLTSKITMPLLSFIVVLMIAPYCIQFSRQSHFFLIYVIGIFTLFTLYTLLETAVILGEYGVFNPLLTLLFPFVIPGAFFTWNFLKKT